MWRWVTLGMVGFVWAMTACGSSTRDSRPGAAQAGSMGVPATGGSGGTAGTNTGADSDAPPIELQDLCPVFTHDLCIYVMQCQGARYEDAAHCERELDCFGLPQLTTAAASGAVEYDPSRVGACHARFLESPCTFGIFLFTPDIYDVLQFCPGTITPKVTEGGACSSNGECSDQLYCYKGADYQCPGKCQPRATEGQSCAASASCAHGFDCEDDVCVPDDQPGDTCDFACNYSVSCPQGEICPGNLWCDQTLGQCQLARLLDEPCGATGVEPNVSQAACGINSWCDAVGNGVGACRKPSAKDGPCNEGSYACQPGLHCVGAVSFGDAPTLGTCQLPGPAGTDCGSGDDCQPGLACAAAKCAAPALEGTTCGGSDECAAGLVCVEGKCAPARYPGDACDGARCTFSRCVDGTCQYHAKVGEPCTAATDCATGKCVAGTCYDDSVCNAPLP